jgi:hypothetical protein
MRFAAANLKIDSDWWFFVSEDAMCAWLMNPELSRDYFFVPEFIGNDEE